MTKHEIGPLNTLPFYKWRNWGREEKGRWSAFFAQRLSARYTVCPRGWIRPEGEPLPSASCRGTHVLDWKRHFIAESVVVLNPIYNHLVFLIKATVPSEICSFSSWVSLSLSSKKQLEFHLPCVCSVLCGINCPGLKHTLFARAGVTNAHNLNISAPARPRSLQEPPREKHKRSTWGLRVCCLQGTWGAMKASIMALPPAARLPRRSGRPWQDCLPKEIRRSLRERLSSFQRVHAGL